MPSSVVSQRSFYSTKIVHKLQFLRSCELRLIDTLVDRVLIAQNRKGLHILANEAGITLQTVGVGGSEGFKIAEVSASDRCRRIHTRIINKPSVKVKRSFKSTQTKLREYGIE